MRWTVAGRLVCLLFLLWTAGCSRREMVPVQGIVRLDGKPLAGASVLFLSQAEGGRDARGSTDADGVFHLTTTQLKDGALPGTYKVVVQPPVPANLGEAAASPHEAQQGASRPARAAIILPPRFSQPDQTILVQEIPPTGEIVFDLQSR